MIEIDDVVKRYGDVTALAGVSFDVAPGTAVGLVGPNGAGKSTLIRILCGLARPDSGSVRLGGGRKLGCMPEVLPLFELLTGREQLVWTGTMTGLDAACTKARVAELAGALELEQALDKPISTYSSGMKKKLAFIAAVLGDPKVLVLDEPFEGVDLLGLYTMKDIVAQLAAAGAAILIASHILPLLEDVCSSFVLLHQGRIVLRGERDTLHARAGAGGSLESVFLDVIAPHRRARRIESIGREVAP